MMLRIGLLLVSLLLGAPAMAAPCPAVDGATVEWAASCFAADKGGRRLKPQYLKQLRFDRSGHATAVISEPRELVALDRQGRVVVPGIRHAGDFDYPDAEGGIGRFDAPPAPGRATAPRCGYFDSRDFRIVVPAGYAQCQPFAKGEAIACQECVSVCTEPECQDSMLVDGDGVALGPDGAVRRRFRLPDMKAVCASPGSKAGKTYEGARPHCIPKSDNPFK
ncbi:hypothetical protein LQ564_22975 [Massilia sp. G4R7]|uniref:Uncharacterized protein n=1 Tax=Massilia phyllostachyos TaxID=2898585 RepID=A0ABS8QEC4_9BURK|nr:hypothetical protein [Massilia phyllostachyos]MCD2519170.1 hypothetical protein [Massilia phyllostachyos]